MSKQTQHVIMVIVIVAIIYLAGSSINKSTGGGLVNEWNSFANGLVNLFNPAAKSTTSTGVTDTGLASSLYPQPAAPANDGSPLNALATPTPGTPIQTMILSSGVPNFLGGIDSGWNEDFGFPGPLYETTTTPGADAGANQQAQPVASGTSGVVSVTQGNVPASSLNASSPNPL